MRARCPSLLTLSVAIGLIAAQVSSILHLTLVEHERCSEHGEIVEARRPHRDRTRVVTPSAPRGPSVAGALAAGHQHDCCLALLDRRTSPSSAVVSSVALVVDTAPPSMPAARVAPARGPPLLHLAPKSSPPA
jgi:hypothetical protein